MEKVLTFNQIDELAKKLANYVEENTVIALIGELGTGKTTFTKTFAKEFGVKENLKSPTFNYVLEYLSGRMPLYHFDVYRLCNSEEIYEIGYEDYINNGGVALIEWANIILEDLPKEYIRIEFKYTTKENELLALLCSHANEILQRDFALKTIWIDDNYFNARSMDVYITKLRKHLKDDDQIEIINIHGKGYKLITPEQD